MTRREALEAGFSDRVVERLVRTGVLRRVRRGVFVLAGAPVTQLTVIRAGLAAVGPGAVASHETAAWLAGLVDRPPEVVHACTTSAYTRRVPGVVVHRSSRPLRIRSFQGVACTDVARTLVDVAGRLRPAEVASAVDRALAGGLTRLGDLVAELGSGRRGGAALRRCLIERGDICGPTASVLEARMARLFRSSGLPIPRAEVHAGPGGRYRIDYAFEDRPLALELYGYAWHHSPEHMTRDLARQRRLALDGWLVLIFSWPDVVHHAPRVVAEIGAGYARAGARRG